MSNGIGIAQGVDLRTGSLDEVFTILKSNELLDVAAKSGTKQKNLLDFLKCMWNPICCFMEGVAIVAIVAIVLG